MNLSENSKNNMIETIQTKLSYFSEVSKIVLFGSFPKIENPNDIIQNSNDNYLMLSLKYRKALRELSKQISLDIIPIRSGVKGSFLNEINQGYVIYER